MRLEKTAPNNFNEQILRRCSARKIPNGKKKLCICSTTMQNTEMDYSPRMAQDNLLTLSATIGKCSWCTSTEKLQKM